MKLNAVFCSEAFAQNKQEKEHNEQIVFDCFLSDSNKNFWQEKQDRFKIIFQAQQYHKPPARDKDPDGRWEPSNKSQFRSVFRFH